MSAEQTDIRKTMRIDLTADGKVAAASPASEATSSPGRAKMSMGTKVPSYIQNKSDYQELLQSVYDAALIATPVGRITDVNVRAEEFFLYKREELLEQDVGAVIEGLDESVLATLRSALEEERFSLLQGMCRRRDGSLFPAEIAVNKLRLKQVRLCFFVRDITVRHQAERLLKREHSAIQSCGTPMLVAEADGAIVIANPALAALLGEEDAASLLGQQVLPLFGNNETLAGLIELAERDPQTWMNDLDLEREDGHTQVLRVTAAFSRHDDDSLMDLVLSFVDITEFRQI